MLPVEDKRNHEKWLAELERDVPLARGLCLDLGGNQGWLRKALEARGYSYINIDARRFANREPSVIGDAHRLPLKDSTADLIISKDTLEHFLEPWTVISEVHRVLKQNGQFVISVPFMFPFHGDDAYRFTPLGLRHLLKDFDFVLFDSTWMVTIFGLMTAEMMTRLGLGFTRSPLLRLCHFVDGVYTRRKQRPAAFASEYRLVVAKR